MPSPCHVILLNSGWPADMIRKYITAGNHFNADLCALVEEDPDPDFMQRVASYLGVDDGTVRSLKGMFEKAGAMSISTAYSGIDAPSTSILSMLACAESELQFDLQHPQHFFAIEWNQHCQEELQMHPGKPQCLFGNLEDFLSQHLRCVLMDLVEADKLKSVLQPVILENTSANGAVSTWLGFR